MSGWDGGRLTTTIVQSWHGGKLPWRHGEGASVMGAGHTSGYAAVRAEIQGNAAVAALNDDLAALRAAVARLKEERDSAMRGAALVIEDVKRERDAARAALRATLPFLANYQCEDQQEGDRLIEVERAAEAALGEGE